MKIPAYPGHSPFVGYSTQTWLSKAVNEFLHPGIYYCWFARSFNAMSNGDDSNPIWLYLILDRAVAQGGVKNAKIKDVRANLMLAVERELRIQGRESEISPSFAAIAAAPIQVFTPQVWRIDMGKLIGKTSSGYQYPDELLASSLSAGDFEVIID
jgi:hypothetical protein